VSDSGSANLETEVRWLADRARITDLLHGYAFGLDTRDWQRWQELFVDDVVGEFPHQTYSGRESLVAGISRIGRWAATEHFISNHQIEIDGDRARSVAYLHAVHVPRADAPDEHYDMGGWYLVHYRRTRSGWRITRLTLVRSWSAGEAHRMPLREDTSPSFGQADMERARRHLWDSGTG
jgi:3-phenylpropionate/cinnamic acid dioxygenase small subunit